MASATTKAATAAALIPTVMAVAASAAQAAPPPPTKTLTWNNGGAGCAGTLKIENVNGTATASSTALCGVSLGQPPFARIKVSLKPPGTTSTSLSGYGPTSVGSINGSPVSGGAATVKNGTAVTGDYTACTVYQNSAGTAIPSFSGTASGAMACVTGPIK